MRPSGLGAGARRVGRHGCFPRKTGPRLQALGAVKRGCPLADWPRAINNKRGSGSRGASNQGCVRQRGGRAYAGEARRNHVPQRAAEWRRALCAEETLRPGASWEGATCGSSRPQRARGGPAAARLRPPPGAARRGRRMVCFVGRAHGPLFAAACALAARQAEQRSRISAGALARARRRLTEGIVCVRASSPWGFEAFLTEGPSAMLSKQSRLSARRTPRARAARPNEAAGARGDYASRRLSPRGEWCASWGAAGPGWAWPWRPARRRRRRPRPPPPRRRLP